MFGLFVQAIDFDLIWNAELIPQKLEQMLAVSFLRKCFTLNN